jgi:hypothetical protein
MTTKIPVELSSTPGIVDGSNATAITIDSSENVGIGTTSPSYKLTISTADEDHLRFENGSEIAIIRLTDAGLLDFWAHGSDEITFTNGTGSGTERMRIDASGNVGIGIASAFGTASNRTAVSVNGTTDVSLNVGTGGSQRAYLYADSSFARLSTIGAIPLLLGTNDTERMRIDSSGNVGIRNSSPASLNSLGGSQFVIGDGTGTQNLYIYSTTNGSGHIAFADSNANGSSAQYAGLIQYNHTENRMRFYTNATEKMRIDSSGNVGIGTTSPSTKLEVNGGIRLSGLNGGDGLKFDMAGSADYVIKESSTNDIFSFGGTIHHNLSSGNVGVGDVSPAYRLELPNTASSAGQGRANAWVTYSDSRIKSNIQTLSYGLDIVKQLKPSQYKHHNSIKEDGQFVKQEEGTNDIGFIAQEVLPLMPEVVGIPEDTDKDLYSINYPKLTAVLTKAIQEQQEQIEQLKTEIQTLKGE